MNAKERLTNILTNRVADRPPVICPGGMMNMVVTELMDNVGYGWPEAHTDPVLMAELSSSMHCASGIENVGVPFCMTVEAEALGATIDLGDRHQEPKVIDYPVSDMQEFLSLPDLDPEARRARVCVAAVKNLRSMKLPVPVIANLVGPVSLVTSVMEPAVFYRTLRKAADSAHEAIDRATRDIIRFGEALVQAGAEVLCISDPSATGEILGTTSFDQFAFPALQKIANRFRDVGVPTILHICGRTDSLGHSLGRLDISAISVDSLVPLEKMRQLISGKCVMGNVSTDLLHRGTPQAVIRAAQRSLVSGADILSPACGISPKTPLVNMKALVTAVNEWISSSLSRFEENR